MLLILRDCRLNATLITFLLVFFCQTGTAGPLKKVDDWHAEKPYLQYAYLSFPLNDQNLAILSNLTINGGWYLDIQHLSSKRGTYQVRLFTNQKNASHITLNQNRAWYDQYKNMRLKNFAFEGGSTEFAKYLSKQYESGTTPIFVSRPPNISSILLTFDR